jgi:nucleoside-diphosphate-sugar epimerase
MEKILVTGANGFIGSNLVKRLLSDGNEVRSLVRKTSDLSFLEGLDTQLFYGDINDKESVKTAMQGVSKVYHVAGLAADWGAYELFEKVNFKGVQNIARVASQAGVSKMIYISTVAFHGFGKTNMNEDSPIPDDLIPYAKTKYLAEQWLWQFQNETDMKITAVRPGNVFGVNDRTFMLKYLEAMLSGKFSEINKGRSKTCPVFIDNLIDIITLAGNNDKANGEAFIATDGLDIDWHTFNTKLADALDIKLPKTSIPYGIAYAVAKMYYGVHKLIGVKSEPFLTPYRVNNGGKDYHFSIDKLKQFFNYSPRVSLDDAVAKTVHWYKNRNN